MESYFLVCFLFFSKVLDNLFEKILLEKNRLTNTYVLKNKLIGNDNTLLHVHGDFCFDCVLCKYLSYNWLKNVSTDIIFNSYSILFYIQFYLT